MTGVRKLKPLRALLLAGSVLGAALAGTGVAHAMTLEEAVQEALNTNPEIGQAIENRAAILKELRQARGFYFPRVDVQASVGPRLLNNPSRRALGIEDDTLATSEVSANVSQLLFDGLGRESEVERQASRADAAAFRVLERSEFIALNVAREYFELLLQEEIIRIAESNVAFHQRVLGNIRRGAQGGAYTVADREQADERLLSARATVTQARQDLETARAAFNRLVGQPAAGGLTMPKSLAGALPASLEAAVEAARSGNPRTKIAEADVDTAGAQLRAARSEYFPEFALEGTARTGYDVDGVEGQTDDLQARLVMRWRVYNGGIDAANEDEQEHRLHEAKLVNAQVHREVEEALRLAWDAREKQAELAATLSQQAAAGGRVVGAYEEQFGVGRRSLLDVLDAQNTQLNTQVRAETARYAALYSEYRVQAATGALLSSLALTPPPAATADQRAKADVPRVSSSRPEPHYPAAGGK